MEEKTDADADPNAATRRLMQSHFRNLFSLIHNPKQEQEQHNALAQTLLTSFDELHHTLTQAYFKKDGTTIPQWISTEKVFPLLEGASQPTPPDVRTTNEGFFDGYHTQSQQSLLSTQADTLFHNLLHPLCCALDDLCITGNLNEARAREQLPALLDQEAHPITQDLGHFYAYANYFSELIKKQGDTEKLHELVLKEAKEDKRYPDQENAIIQWLKARQHQNMAGTAQQAQPVPFDYQSLSVQAPPPKTSASCCGSCRIA